MLNFTIRKLFQNTMAKQGKEKNTNNKAKHTKLITQKKNKKKSQVEDRKARLKAIVQKSKDSKSE
ncbi:hypothetical protein [Winogradskyella helgolandensis]|uniref:hypothetical protein n=1 Tax=Winogradskyella helgolandensis TaxID=2697010 RepID=UPI0015BFC33A|nr:hypothetical protein [Winogradskyella helgolandensis]